jgi:hypothetical protein
VGDGEVTLEVDRPVAADPGDLPLGEVAQDHAQLAALVEAILDVVSGDRHGAGSSGVPTRDVDRITRGRLR